MDRKILIDNDALLKLARYGLLDEAVTCFDCISTNVCVLATAKYSLFPAKNRLRLCKEEISASRLEAFLQNCNFLNPQSADPELLDILSAVENIDAGEALLLAVGATDQESLVITGDKRSLIALCTNDSVVQASASLAGRIVSLEVLFWFLVEHQFTYVQECVIAKPDVDKALKIVFGITAPASVEVVREGLTSYINHLRAVTGNLLYVPF